MNAHREFAIFGRLKANEKSEGEAKDTYPIGSDVRVTIVCALFGEEDGTRFNFRIKTLCDYKTFCSWIATISKSNNVCQRLFQA